MRPALPEDLGRASERHLRSLLAEYFMARIGWDEQAGTLTPDRNDPLLGLAPCQVPGCFGWVSHSGLKVCQRCAIRHRASGLDWGQFLAIPNQGRLLADRDCAVADCPRPGGGIRSLCDSHDWKRAQRRDLSLEQWLALPGVSPLSDLGPCRVEACTRKAARVRQRLCGAHQGRWKRAREAQPELDFEDWLTLDKAIGRAQITVIKALPERVQLEVLLALQQRTARGIRTFPSSMRCLVAVLQAQRVHSLLELADVPGDGTRLDATRLARSMAKELYCALSDTEQERHRDRWNLAVFGIPGTLDFTPIHQRWLRETVKTWAAEDLHLRRGSDPASPARQAVNVATWLSNSLHDSAPGRGEDPGLLGRCDIIAFCNRMAHAERTEQMTNETRLRLLRHARKVLDDAHHLGLTRNDGPAAGLPGDFCLRRGDIPPEADKNNAGRDLPTHIVQAIAANLHVLEERCGTSERRITEILIDTGRRPDEVCTLPWDCLAQDTSGQPVLVFNDLKNNRPGRRLPIAQETAAVLAAQKKDIVRRFPGTPVDQLALFPRDAGNREGTKPLRADAYGNGHRIFIGTIAHLLIDHDGSPFNTAKCVPYAYRHTYAQRHADAGVPPDVLRELMCHRSLRSTAGYYRISAHRLRAAVDKVARHQFDGAGVRVFQRAAALLADDRARIAVGQVAVPFGMCTEPSNVKAAGQACPFKYTCIGCGHFRTDPSYLPELKSYLQQLLADRERFVAATELTDWARAQLAPPAEQIDQLRDLIRHIESDLSLLSDTDRAQIEHTVTAIRRTRQTVDLGMPTINSLRIQTR
jgi:integrase